jgi:4-coumarate--CoA ligase
MPSFDLPLFCRIIATHRITYGYVAPPVVLHLAKNPLVDNYDLSSLRFLTSGAAPLTKELILEVHKRIGLRVKQAYGLSETSPVSHVQEWDGSWLDCIGSVGPPLPNLEQIFVVPSASSSTSSSSSSSSSGGPSGGGGSLAGFTLCKPGEPGEMWLRGPTVFRGYLNNVEATKGCKTDDGWFKTGDIGFEDAQGNMYITDRVKELIKYKGSQVAPAELEGLLLSNADVEDVCVLGVYVDAAATEVPVAAVVLSPKVADRVKAEGDYESEARKIVEWMKARTAKSKWLRGGVVFVDVVHKSAAGKILRRLVKGDVEKAGMAGKVYAAQKWEERGGVKAKL